MATGTILQICRAPARRAPMESVQEAMLIAGRGMKGDRYGNTEGSYQFGEVGKRQLTLMHKRALDIARRFQFIHTRRGVLIDGEDIELAWLLGKRHEFRLGGALVQAVGYCDPCERPTREARYPVGMKEVSFEHLFKELGGLILAVKEGGPIRVGDEVVTPDKKYAKSE